MIISNIDCLQVLNCITLAICSPPTSDYGHSMSTWLLNYLLPSFQFWSSTVICSSDGGIRPTRCYTRNCYGSWSVTEYRIFHIYYYHSHKFTGGMSTFVSCCITTVISISPIITPTVGSDSSTTTIICSSNRMNI